MLKTKSMRQIEQKMASIEPGSLRYQVLEHVRNFKASWIALGQILYTVSRDKIYKEWGYMTFEAYCHVELGIQKTTATKLLYSYHFLEKNEPQFLRAVQSSETVDPKEIPGVDAVNVLRLASDRGELTEDDYQDFKRSVFEEGKDAKSIRREMGARLRFLAEQEDPQEAREERRTRTLRRFLATVRTLEKETVGGRLVSSQTAHQIRKLLEYLEKEIGKKP